MANLPLVSVITPTFNRRNILLDQCIPSVQAQTYPNIEHIVIVDGPGELPMLAAMLHARISDNREAFHFPVHLLELEKNYGSEAYGLTGNEARRRGATQYAKGDLITYLDDDDIYFSPHIELLQHHINQSPEYGFAYSIAKSNWFTGPQYIGYSTPSHGNITCSAIMHRKGLTDIANWRDHAPAHMEKSLCGCEVEREEDWHLKNGCPDWDITKRWVEAGVKWNFVRAVTVEMRPHSYKGMTNLWKEAE